MATLCTRLFHNPLCHLSLKKVCWDGKYGNNTHWLDHLFFQVSSVRKYIYYKNRFHLVSLLRTCVMFYTTVCCFSWYRVTPEGTIRACILKDGQRIGDHYFLISHQTLTRQNIFRFNILKSHFEIAQSAESTLRI